ncbi:hypothetical protein BJ741DRAFT_706799 [Chytriomyces cf. hyalinus JEL632]|nr:hypothetical protein BJ741DRAFT_706799 [Chytriomyces cf. hyalinus JEL632]
MIFNKLVATAILFAYASIAFPANQKQKRQDNNTPPELGPPPEIIPGGAVSSIPSVAPEEITPTSFAAVPSPLLDTAFPPVANDVNGLCGGGSSFKNPLACKPGLVCAKQVGATEDTLGTCQIPNVSDIGGDCGGAVFNAATCAVGLVCIPDTTDETLPGLCQIVVSVVPTPTSAAVGLGGLVTGTEEVIATGGIVGTEPAGTPTEVVPSGGIVGTPTTTAATSETTIAVAPASTTTTKTTTPSQIISTVFGENFPPALTSFTTSEVPPSPSNGGAIILPTLETEVAEPPSPSIAPAGTEPVSEVPSNATSSPSTTVSTSSTTTEEAPPTPSNPAAGTEAVPEPSSASSSSEEVPPTPSNGEAETEPVLETLPPLTVNSPKTTVSSTATSEELPPSPSVPAAETEPVTSDAVVTSESTTSVEVPPSPSVPAAQTESVSPSAESSASSEPTAESTSDTAVAAETTTQAPTSEVESSSSSEAVDAPITASSVEEMSTTVAETTSTAEESPSDEPTSVTTSDSAIFIPEGPTENSSTSADEVPPSPSEGAGDIVSTTDKYIPSVETSDASVAPPLFTTDIPSPTTQEVSTTTTEASTTTTDSVPKVLTLPEAYSAVTSELSTLPSCLIGCLNLDHSTSVTDETATDLCIDAFGNDPFALVMCIVSDCSGNDFDTVINALTDPTITDNLSNACSIIYASIPETVSSSIESSSTAETTTTTAAAVLSPIFSSSTWSMFAQAPVKNGINGTCGGYTSDAATCLPGLKCVSNNAASEVGTCQKPIVNDGVGQTCGGSISNNPASCGGSLACMPNFIPGLPGTCQIPAEPTSSSLTSSLLSVVRPTTATKKHKKFRMVIKTVECTTTTVTTTTSTQYAFPSSSP